MFLVMGVAATIHAISCCNKKEEIEAKKIAFL